MKISINQELPNSTLSQMTADGPKAISLASLTVGKKVVLVGMPGAFTETCTNQHLPSLIRNSSALFDKGIDKIICLVTNDIHVAKAWGEMTGATKAGIDILCDVESKFAIASGLSFSAPPVGFFHRLQRVSILLNNNFIKHIQLEETRSQCELTSGETILRLIDETFDF
tara:strand:- start:101 stop:607 length:507 start_codon:yes stop_codon:yes gene_type:complete